MKRIALMTAIITCIAAAVHSMENTKVDCFTEKKEYLQGENIFIHIRNDSMNGVSVVDRKYVDGGFASIEIKSKEGTWEAIELVAAANITTFKTLDSGESHIYIWNTKGYDRNDALAVPGVYRVIFSENIKTNEFLIKANPKFN
jgi:hypothetical protein